MEVLMRLSDVAKALRISRSRAYVSWPKWSKFGVRPIRANGEGRVLLFRETEIKRMVKDWEVQK